MSQHVVEILLGRILTDESFRRVFFADPVALCHEEALKLTPVEVEALSALDPRHVQAFAAGLDGRIVRAPLMGGRDWSRWTSPPPATRANPTRAEEGVRRVRPTRAR